MARYWTNREPGQLTNPASKEVPVTNRTVLSPRSAIRRRHIRRQQRARFNRWAKFFDFLKAVIHLMLAGGKALVGFQVRSCPLRRNRFMPCCLCDKTITSLITSSCQCDKFPRRDRIQASASCRPRPTAAPRGRDARSSAGSWSIRDCQSRLGAYFRWSLIRARPARDAPGRFRGSRVRACR